MDLIELAETGHRTGARLVKAVARAMQDIVFPHHAFDAGSRAASAGLSALGWKRVTFLEAPVCDGCAQPAP